MFVTLDGVVQGPGGPDEDPSGGFDLGGWLAPYFDDDSGQARLLTFPVVLGKGKRLFAEGAKPVALDHVHRTTTSTGVSIDVYTPAGQPTFGSVGSEYEGDHR